VEFAPIFSEEIPIIIVWRYMMKKGLFYSIALFCFISFFSSFTYAAHPLITDDTGTQGTGKFQLEINSEYAWDREYGIKEKAGEVATILSYGIVDNMDLVFGIPYALIDDEEIDTGMKSKVRGIGDASIELKWRFYEKDGLSMALKPGVILPTGDYDKGLSNGRISYGAFFILTKEVKPINMHLNLGFYRNESKNEQRRDIWHASIAGEYEVTEHLKIVGNIGIETNPDLEYKTEPAFALVGFIYSFTDSLSFDVGYKYGLTKPESDNTLLLGFTFKF
jgi:hypothetical protein